jgi:ABC-type lipoprotein release transport system permease subunit
MARRDMIDWEIGGGVYWHARYDPYDAFVLQESHGRLSPPLVSEAANGSAVPVLISQGTLYPEGRMQNVLLKGIPPLQTVLQIPTPALQRDGDAIPVLLGTRMAENSRLRIGDIVLLRWRDAHGTFDADEAVVAGIFKTNVPSVDVRQLWIPLDRLQSMLAMPGEATLVVLAKDAKAVDAGSDWTFKDHAFLLADIERIIKTKSVGGSVLYVVMMFLALLAIFDTQVFSVFRRQKEIGTHLALGMTRGQVIRLFTAEGALHGILAAVLAAVYGIPLLGTLAAKGWKIPPTTDNFGLVIAERIFPVYGVGLVLGTVLLILLATTVVSYLPARKISRMKPTDALRGRIQ